MVVLAGIEPGRNTIQPRGHYFSRDTRSNDMRTPLLLLWHEAQAALGMKLASAFWITGRLV